MRLMPVVCVPGQPCYIAHILYPNAGSSSRLTAQNPVIGAGGEYYDDRLLEPREVERSTVVLSGTPGSDQTDGLRRLLDRVEVLVRSGWRGG